MIQVPQTQSPAPSFPSSVVTQQLDSDENEKICGEEVDRVTGISVADSGSKQHPLTVIAR